MVASGVPAGSATERLLDATAYRSHGRFGTTKLSGGREPEGRRARWGRSRRGDRERCCRCRWCWPCPTGFRVQQRTSGMAAMAMTMIGKHPRRPGKLPPFPPRMAPRPAVSARSPALAPCTGGAHRRAFVLLLASVLRGLLLVRT